MSETRVQPVTVVITCAVQPEKLDAARRELQGVIRQVMALEPACKGIRVHEAPDAPHRWLIVEQWESQAHFVGPHMQQPHMKDFMRTAETFVEGKVEFAFWHEAFVA